MNNNETELRGVVEIIPNDTFQEKQSKGEKLKIYLGVDPTGPAIHIGHAVILRALAQLQQQGHHIILLIGDFTARIGDPTDKEAARTALTHEEVLQNANTYQQQAAKMLDFDHPENPAVLAYNSQWLDALTFHDVIELSSEFTVQQMLERDMFEKRINEGKPIHVHEFLYPIMQGYDSVALDVDVECGGTDQLFNMLAGRTLVKNHNNKEKIVITFELLEGLDGRKMSKSYGNTVGVNDTPQDMFGKIMSLADELIVRYFQLATDFSAAEIDVMAQRLQTENPRDIKAELAAAIVELYHSSEAAMQAREDFFAQFADKKLPKEIPEYRVTPQDTDIVTLLVNANIATSKGEARRLIEQGGVRINEKKVNMETMQATFSAGDIIQVGKRRFLKIVE